MNKGIARIMMVGLIATSLLASCKKNNPSGGGTADGLGFTATTEQDGGNSKTHLDGLEVKWTAYDQIKVANYGGGSGSTTLTYELTEGAGNTQGIFYTGADHADFFHPDYVAAYPAAKVTSISGSTVTFNLLKTQTLGENSFGEGCNPMVAYSSNQTLQFKNVLGALCFRFKGVDKIGSLRLTSKNTSDKLWGSCEVIVGSDGVPTGTTITNTDADKHVITLNCNNIQLDDDEETLFYIMLPPGTLASGFTLEVLDESGTVFYAHDGSIGTSTAYPEGRIVRNRVIKPSQALYMKVGAIHGTFSVSATDKVYFSTGNLQYSRTGSHAVNGGGTTDGTFRFATNQWDCVGGSNSTGTYGNVSGSTNNSISVDSYTGWIDLFGWGTSGWTDDPNGTNEDVQPYSYASQSFGSKYGPIGHHHMLRAYANYDWGVYNAISNGGNASNQWRTLEKDEWNYLLNTRTVTVGGVDKVPYGLGKVNGIYGLIILPDNWDGSVCGSFTSYAEIPTWPDVPSTNIFDESTSPKWSQMEATGAVFLPLTGFRNAASMYYIPNTTDDNWFCCYWTATSVDASTAYDVRIGYVNTTGYKKVMVMDSSHSRGYGESVRLVHDIP